MRYLNELRRKFSKFRKNEGGNIFITTALISPLMIVAIGAGVDTAEMYRNRVNFQNALDAGTVFATKVFAATNSKSKAETAGRRVFNANMGNTTETYKHFKLADNNPNCSGGKIVGIGEMRHPIFFAKIYSQFGNNPTNQKDEMTLTARTEVSCTNSTLELALVLDVSKSMKNRPNKGSDRKIDSLENAATSLVTKLHTAFEKHPNSEALKISVVPFAGMVNIGKNNKNKDWMDKLGQASYHHEELGWSWGRGQEQLSDGGWEDRKTGERLTRFTLFDQLEVDWAGCVLHRPHPYNVTDVPPNSVDPETLFVPAFAPDTPDQYSGNYWPDKKGNGRKNKGTKLHVQGEEKYANNYIDDFNNSPYKMSKDNTGKDNQYKRLYWPHKYFKDKDGNPPARRTKVNKQEKMGPNHYCVSQPIIPLTIQKKPITDLLADLQMGFGTEIHQGILWGWRTLSPGEPFTQGRTDEEAFNKKVMIVMTDGANYIGESKTGNGSRYPGSQYYAHGFTRNKRIWQGTELEPSASDTLANFRVAMNDLQRQTCDNAKEDGITIYTIAFDIKDDTDRAEVMKYCASHSPTGKLLYLTADDGDELVEVFEKIATDMGSITVIK